MKTKAVLLALLFGSLLLAIGSCSNQKGKSADNGLAMDSASIAQRAKDEWTLSTLKDKKLAAEQRAKEATENTKEAKRIQRDADDAADQARKAFETEEAAQRSRQQADDQAAKAERANSKSDEN